MHQVEVCLNNEMGRLKELHLKESQIWAQMKTHYEEAATANKRKIENLKKALEESQARSQIQKDWIRVLLQTKQERFMTYLQAALDKGWAGWAKQAAELHTYRADWENRRKEGKGFYKLNEESIAAVEEDLTQDYHVLADRHSEEITQLLEDLNESQEDIFHQLCTIGSEHQRAEAITVQDSDSVE